MTDTKDLLERLFNINRSLTGPGVRETIAVINDELGGILNVHEIPSGRKVFDWTVPPEWRFHRASMKHESGRVVFDTDAGDSWLHVVGYSAPMNAVVYPKTRFGLSDRIHVGPKSQPDAVQHVTAYYSDPPGWGVCLSWNQWRDLEPGACNIVIESEFLENGSLTLADAVIPGEIEDEIILSTYTCHPAHLANNETSGLVVLTELVKWWQDKPRRHSLRVLLAPETIGPLVYMASGAELSDRQPESLWWLKRHVRAGFTLTCMGGNGPGYVQDGRQPNYASRIAKSVWWTARRMTWAHRVSDERQWCAPGIDLPWATLMKTHPKDPDYRDRYHTSADDLSYVTADQLEESVEMVKKILRAIEADRTYQATTLGEPQLGRRGLYDTISKTGSSESARALLDVLSFCDGRSTLEIAVKLDEPFYAVQEQLDVIEKHGLIQREKKERDEYPRYDLMLEYWEEK